PPSTGFRVQWYRPGVRTALSAGVPGGTIAAGATPRQNSSAPSRPSRRGEGIFPLPGPLEPKQAPLHPLPQSRDDPRPASTELSVLTAAGRGEATRGGLPDRQHRGRGEAAAAAAHL